MVSLTVTAASFSSFFFCFVFQLAECTKEYFYLNDRTGQDLDFPAGYSFLTLVLDKNFSFFTNRDFI
jgi:hypothetical protein